MGKICFSLKSPNENARGCFHTVGRTETEADIDSGFYGLLDGAHYDEYGKKTKKGNTKWKNYFYIFCF